jgi:hypothetical protein
VSREPRRAAAARRDLGVLVGCVLAGAWLAPLLPGAAARAAAVAAGGLGLGWALWSLRRQGVSPRELGLRGDNLWSAVPVFLTCALLTVAGFAAAGLLDPAAPGRLADPRALASYAVWALFQQLLVVGVLWRHARWWLGAGRCSPRLSGAELGAVLVTALGFALIHAPNLRLMALVGGAELVWLLLFTRFPNLFALASVHAVSALAVAEALQPGWLPTARIGLSYLER